MFELPQPSLNGVLCHARDGKLQLPDFQRGWVWEEDVIASLFASVARSFPVGTLLTLKTGGTIRFEPRTVEGAPPACSEPDELLLDGQQRITSLFQAFMRDMPVDTRTAQGRKRKVFYYLNIVRALEPVFPDEAVEIIDESRTGARDFLTRERVEIANFLSESFDIHHIFPRRWCENRKPRISRDRYNTIVNKSAISARTNRRIGGGAPSAYCAMIDKDTSAAGIALDDILESHKIDASLLRADDFDAFYAARKAALLDMIEAAMGKAAARDGTGQAGDYDEEQMVEALAAKRRRCRIPDPRIQLNATGRWTMPPAVELLVV